MIRFDFAQSIRWLNAVLVLLVVWFVVKVAMQVWQNQSDEFSLLLPTLKLQEAAPLASHIALKGELFGMPQSSATANTSDQETEKVDSQVLNETRLRLTLKGIIVTPKKQVALIDSGANTLVLMVGDQVSSQVKVNAIYSNYVVVDNKGVLEKLVLPEVEVRGIPSNNSKATGALTSDQSKKLETLREKLKASPLTINRYVRVRPITKDGKVETLQLWPRTEKAVFEALGFRAGDRLMAVNGQSITELAADMSKWQSMMGLSQLQFTVNRNGGQQTIDVNLK